MSLSRPYSFLPSSNYGFRYKASKEAFCLEDRLRNPAVLMFMFCSYKVTKGLLDRFGEKRVIDSPITESGFCGLTVGAALAGLHPVVMSLLIRLENTLADPILAVRVYDLQFCYASYRSNHQFGSQDTLHVRRYSAVQHYLSRTKRLRFWCCCTTFARLLKLVR